jgi:hypothetical protein
MHHDYEHHERRIHAAAARAMVAEAARIRAELCAQRGLPPSQACKTCECRPQVAPCECESEGGHCD